MAYQTRRGKHLEIRMDPDDARATVYYRYPGDDWDVTPFQTADARHDLSLAYRMVRDWDASQGSRRTVLRRNQAAIRNPEDEWGTYYEWIIDPPPGEYLMDTHSFEEYAPGGSNFVLRRVLISPEDYDDRETMDYRSGARKIKILEGPERGRIVTMRSPAVLPLTGLTRRKVGGLSDPDSTSRAANPSIRSYGIQRYQQALEALRGKHEKRLSANTVLRNIGGGEIQVILHATPVVTFYEDGRVRLRSGGWMTSTTKARINQFSPFRVSQKRGEWTVTLPGGETMEFEDGMVIS